MAGISRYEKVMLLLTAGFLLFCGGWFLAGRFRVQPYQVTAAQQAGQVQMLAQREAGAPDSLLTGEKIDLNTAAALELQRLPGVGEKRARDIVAYREEHGSFQSVEQLIQISGIGEATLDQMREYITVSNQQP